MRQAEVGTGHFSPKKTVLKRTHFVRFRTRKRNTRTGFIKVGGSRPSPCPLDCVAPIGVPLPAGTPTRVRRREPNVPNVVLRREPNVPNVVLRREPNVPNVVLRREPNVPNVVLRREPNVPNVVLRREPNVPNVVLRTCRCGHKATPGSKSTLGQKGTARD